MRTPGTRKPPRHADAITPPGLPAVRAPLVGCAGWSLPHEEWPHFASEGTHLERYASRFTAAEINSSFYRPHRTTVYARWAASVPVGFRFAVKVPKAITHTRRLVGAGEPLDAFLAEATGLGEKLGCLLVQLPPSLPFDAAIAAGFFGALRERSAVDVACEPRHASWFTRTADRLLAAHRVARVAADPAVVPEAADPGGADSLRYHRLHGTPRRYYSRYEDEYLEQLADRLRGERDRGARVWCIFDNTAAGAAVPNARDLLARIEKGAAPGAR